MSQTDATKSNSESSQEVRTVNKRGAARLAAVQALYQMDVSQGRLAEVLAEYENHRIGQEVDGEEYVDADLGWFRGIVGGVVEEQKLIDPLIHQTLPDDWPLSRIDVLLRSVIRCGVFELSKRKDVPAKVVISEYIDVAKAFFDEDEPRLVNAVLDKLARQLRRAEFNEKSGE